MLRHAPLLAVLAALACTSTGGRRAQETLASDSSAAPLEACVGSALATTALVAHVYDSRKDQPRAHVLQLMNPPGTRIQNVSFVIEPLHGKPREFAVQFFRPGAAGMQPAEDPKSAELEVQAVTEISARLLREVRAQCSPTAPGEASCTMVEQGRIARCTLAA